MKSGNNKSGAIGVVILFIFVVMLVFAVSVGGSSSGSSGGRHCSFTYSDGTTCSVKPASGSTLCSYHQKQLNKAVDATKKYAYGN